ncbi:hypothetical protein Unana1_02447 [Umbelopsis nana]
MGMFDWFPLLQKEENADEISKKNYCYYIEGFLSCAYFHAATDIGDRLTDKMKDVKIDVNAYMKAQWNDRLNELKQELKAGNHSTSPFIYEGCSGNDLKFVGGYSDFARLVRDRHRMSVPLD